jgi:hypothetical protein
MWKRLKINEETDNVKGLMVRVKIATVELGI